MLKPDTPINPAARLLNFIETYGGRTELISTFRTIYITCLASNMTDDWDGQQRMDFFYFMEDCHPYLPAVTEVLIPVLKQLNEKLKREGKWQEKDET